MREVSALELLTELESTLPKEPLLVLMGESHYLKDQIVKKYSEKLFGGDISSLDLIKISGYEFNIGEYTNIVSTPPFLNNKLLIIKDVEAISKQNLQKLLSTKIIDNVKVILIYAGKEENLGKENFIIVKDYTVPQTHIEKWIEKKAKDYGKLISKEAVKELISRLDSNLFELSNEIKKLAMFVGTKKSIEEEDVKEIVQKMKEEDIFEFINAVINMEKDKAMKLLDYFLKTTSQENIILSQILKTFSIYLITYDLKKESKTQKEVNEYIASLFGIFLKKRTLEGIYRNLEKIDIKTLVKQYNVLTDIDIKSKSGEVEPKEALRTFIVEKVTRQY